MNPTTLAQALEIIEGTPGYGDVSLDLVRLISRNKLRVNMALPDRAVAGLLGTITLGPEAVYSSPLSLAQTLVHERFHLRQNVFLKTVSFWVGIVTRTSVMRRYERPAYQAAIDFLEAVKTRFPALHEEASREQIAISQVFFLGYGAELFLSDPAI